VIVTKRKPKLVWGKGPRSEVVEIGDAKLTVKGLTYREFRYIAGLSAYEGDAMSFRICVTNVENLLAYKEGESGETEELKITYSHIDIDGKRTKVMSKGSFEIFDSSILTIGQVLKVIQDLSQLTEAEAKTGRLFRNRK